MVDCSETFAQTESLEDAAGFLGKADAGAEEGDAEEWHRSSLVLYDWMVRGRSDEWMVLLSMKLEWCLE